MTRVVISVMTMADHDLPWSEPLRTRRCRARLAHSESLNYFGRCDLRRGHDGAHVLERGLEIVRFVEDTAKEER